MLAADRRLIWRAASLATVSCLARVTAPEADGVGNEKAERDRRTETGRPQRMTQVERFEFRFAPAYRCLARVFGVTPRTAWVEVGEETLEARFGPWRVRTKLTNIAGVAVTGPYAFAKTAGPARLALTDRGLTFATNGDQGVLVTFRAAVPGLMPLSLLRHPELTLTVAEVDGLASLLRARTAVAMDA